MTPRRRALLEAVEQLGEACAHDVANHLEGDQFDNYTVGRDLSLLRAAGYLTEVGSRPPPRGGRYAIIYKRTEKEM